jgi:uncharacterized protein (UPF0216 family)
VLKTDGDKYYVKLNELNALKTKVDNYTEQLETIKKKYKL